MPYYLKKGGRQMSGREYCVSSKNFNVSQRDNPFTVSCSNGRKQLQILEQELSIQPEVSRSNWSWGKESMIKEWSPKGTMAHG